jgi:hypothetical protein
MRALIAARRAFSRTARFAERISGSSRQRPHSVSTRPSRSADSRVVRMYSCTPP